MTKSFKRLFNYRDRLIDKGVEMNPLLSDGMIEFKVEEIGFKQTMDWLRTF